MLVEAKQLLVVTGDPRFRIRADGFDVNVHHVDWEEPFRDQLGHLSDTIGSTFKNGNGALLGLGDAGALTIASLAENPETKRVATVGSRLNLATHRDYSTNFPSSVAEAVNWLTEHRGAFPLDLSDRVTTVNVKSGDDRVPPNARGFEGTTAYEILYKAKGHEDSIIETLTNPDYSEPIILFLAGNK